MIKMHGIQEANQRGRRQRRGGPRLIVAVLVAAMSMALAGPVLAAKSPPKTPTVAHVEPSSGPAAGGTSVTITGSGFKGVSSVKFGSNTASSFTVNSETSITAVSPAGTGTVDVTVATRKGTSPTGSADQFTYQQQRPTVTGMEPNGGPPGGGTVVTITGTGFEGASSVTFGSNSASFRVNSESSITANSPALTPGTNARVEVTVTTPAGTSALTVFGIFHYQPEVTRVSPSSGVEGTSVLIEGRGLKAAAVVPGEVPPPNCGFTEWVCQVRFGTTPTTNYVVREPPPSIGGEPEVVAVAPPGTGTVDVRLSTGAGTSPITLADQFTY